MPLQHDPRLHLRLDIAQDGVGQKEGPIVAKAHPVPALGGVERVVFRRAQSVALDPLGRELDPTVQINQVSHRAAAVRRTFVHVADSRSATRRAYGACRRNVSPGFGGHDILLVGHTGLERAGTVAPAEDVLLFPSIPNIDAFLPVQGERVRIIPR